MKRKLLTALILAILVVAVVWLILTNTETTVITDDDPVPDGPVVVDTPAEPAKPLSEGPREFLIRVSTAGYVPDVIEVDQGESFVIILRSLDGRDHGLSISQLQFSIAASPNRDARATLVARTFGIFEWHNPIGSGPTAGEMKGRLIVNAPE